MSEYVKYLDGIWERGWLTNNGPLVNDLELRLKSYLNISHLLYVNNGTIALQLAIKALGLTGEIITTPFSYVATTSSIVWEGCEAVFVDIEPDSYNIDPTKIEAAITDKTTGIIATHVYGNPCDIDAIDAIAKKHNLKVIYDAAHCFGTTYKGRSVFDHGNVSTTSFHTTKIYHTVEGGAVFAKDPDVLRTMAYMRNFGHDGRVDYFGVGINGKNSEFHAAFGLVNLDHIDEIMSRRKGQYARYTEKLRQHKGIQLTINKDADFNCAYFPLYFESEALLLKSINELQEQYVVPRRYFYPSLSVLPYVKKCDTPISDEVSSRILCLPLYHKLQDEEIDMICRILLRVQQYN
ncbi:DegT/DnrJ/EryC1/StrS family aminotransferase [Mucilaginibacter myungsuensis]|nr:DegT/DnrJ/EryC1/StrS family aminotransferase [Mucilaginibacter myungsuensis]